MDGFIYFSRSRKRSLFLRSAKKTVKRQRKAIPTHFTEVSHDLHFLQRRNTHLVWFWSGDHFTWKLKTTCPGLCPSGCYRSLKTRELLSVHGCLQRLGRLLEAHQDACVSQLQIGWLRYTKAAIQGSSGVIWTEAWVKLDIILASMLNL